MPNWLPPPDNEAAKLAIYVEAACLAENLALKTEDKQPPKVGEITTWAG
jgi:hypothetical protein